MKFKINLVREFFFLEDQRETILSNYGLFRLTKFAWRDSLF